jgi:hypothetical protein
MLIGYANRFGQRLYEVVSQMLRSENSLLGQGARTAMLPIPILLEGPSGRFSI